MTTKKTRARPSTALEAGLRLQGRRGHSEAELRTKLGQKDYTPEDIDRAIAELKRLGALDDHKLAELEAEKLAKKGFVDHALALKLEARGLEDDLVTKAVDGAPLPSLDDALRQFAGTTEAHLLPLKQRLALARKLASRGFEEEVVRGRLRLDEADSD